MVDRAQWQVGGSAPEVYERDLVPAVFGPWARLVVDLADLQSGDRVLDVACGTGVVTRVAAEKVGERGAVVAADLNPGMLALAGSLPAPRGATVEWRQADAGALPFADQAFDVVLCQLGLQFFTDRAIALREMYRVLRPGGDVVVMVWRPIERSPASPPSQRRSSGISGRTRPRSCEPLSRWATPRSSALSSPRRASRGSISEPQPGRCASRPWSASWPAMSPAPRSPNLSQPLLQRHAMPCSPRSLRSSSNSLAATS